MDIVGLSKKLQDKLQLGFKRVGGGSRFFGGAKRGEAAELTAELNSSDKERQKNAVKRVIANMTLGRDVSQLFTDVVKLGQTLNLELKKLVYLYVLNTAKLQQDKALMAVNTFLQDSTHQSPIIRALALRTMMCIRIEAVTEYTLEPLRRAVKDTDPYVRKTAAIGLGKLFHQSPRLFEEQGLVDDVIHLLDDNFSIVASNAAAVLCEIQRSGLMKISIKPKWISRVLNSLADATEWAQCFYLDLIAMYTPPSASDAENIIERTVARLGHTNPAVVLGCVKVLTQMLPHCPAATFTTYMARINAALLSLIKGDAETQYIACKNIQLLLRLYPTLLSSNVDSFFIRFTDPPYVKTEKLKLLLRLTTQTNAAQVVKELQEYSTEVDILFVRDVVHCMASAAIKVESIAQDVVQMLLNLVEKRPEMLSDIVNASKNVVRKYPELCVDLVAPLITEHGAENVVDEEAKVSLVWMLGEFCDILENGAAILKEFLDTFMMQEPSVQLSLLTGVVKIFLRNPAEMEATLNSVLELVTQQSTNPDLLDRAYMYWRILAEGVGVEAMKQIVHGKKTDVDVDNTFGQNLAKQEVSAILNTAAAVYGRAPRTFVPSYGFETENFDDDDELDEDDREEQVGTDQVDTPTAEVPSPENNNNVPPPAQPTAHVDPLDNLFNPAPAAPAAPAAPVAPVAPAKPAADPFDPFAAPIAAAPVAAPTPAASLDPFASLAPTSTPVAAPVSAAPPKQPSIDDLFGGPSPAPAAPAALALPQVVDPARNNGLRINGAVRCGLSDPHVELVLQNTNQAPMHDFVMQLNKNAFGFVPTVPVGELIPSGQIGGGATITIKLPIRAASTHFDAQKMSVEAGLKSSVGLALFHLNLEPTDLLLAPPTIDKGEFVTKWRSLDDTNELKTPCDAINKFATRDAATVSSALARHNVGVVTSAQDAFYATVKTHLSISALVEIVVKRDGSPSTVCIKSLRPADILPAVLRVLEATASTL